MSDRDIILRAIRNSARAPHPRPRPPDFAERYPATPAAFGSTLTLMGGIWDDSHLGQSADPAELSAYIRGLFPAAGRFCSAVAGIEGDIPLTAQTPSSTLESVDVAIVKAGFGVAETGSVWLSERECPANALGFLAQHLVVLLPVAAIVANLHVAYARQEVSTVNYGVLMSGPSATADIEGVLIRGAQGVRSLRVIALRDG
ncbi:LutC/YkgG family protein [Martelella alba]|uniref:LUD domain-containing protein n=1 Tax=Martelella alba TaxID=2590451 RepID=A0ABY2SLG9_9HYPH|nr:LUD domain-containing protein [Martelella alba]TKI06351.1 hypothetical protein FCN80_10975 [Martelella alba]